MSTALGLIAFLLPILVMVNCGLFWLFRENCSCAQIPVHPSISDYYNSESRNIFVGSLCIVATFLFAYEGHARDENKRARENTLATAGGAAALGVAVFPVEQEVMIGWALGWMHAISTVTLFTILVIFCLTHFREQALDTEHSDNRSLYEVCGATIALAIYGVAVIWIADRVFDLPSGVKYGVLALEVVGLWAFGVSWLFHGKALQTVKAELRHTMHGAKAMLSVMSMGKRTRTPDDVTPGDRGPSQQL